MSTFVTSLVRRRMVLDIIRGCRVGTGTARDVAEQVDQATSNVGRFAILTAAGMKPDGVRPFLYRYAYQEPPQGRCVER